MKKSLTYLSSFSLIFFGAFSAQAANKYSSSLYGQFPNISGQVLFELKADRIDSDQASGTSPNNAYINIEPDFSFNFTKNWSVKTGWRLYPTSTITTRDSVHPERTRTFFSADRGFKPQDTTMIVEELKLDYQADDLRFFAGKFNPSFGKAYTKAKRIGVFVTDITEDYELREKIGAGVSAELASSKISANTFFNDTTGLSGSINGRGTESRDNGLAGNTGAFSSYTFTMEGERFFGINNWSYNVGYRKLGVDTSISERANETGYVLGTEYLIKTGYRTSVTPFFEMAKINNFTGAKDRDATYTTLALLGKYGNWTSSISNVTRNIDKYQAIEKVKDRQVQISAGYKFANNIALDVSRADIREGVNTGILYGVMASYLYKF